ncbi:hypothetical protein QQF64_032856 [Cirrhinus molitorella]|uniref:Uncharacterized protein n=1 Tax=Cirrhinus molitorella TaxID=172907 RepID=A0ABR3MS72_9TELE
MQHMVFSQKSLKLYWHDRLSVRYKGTLEPCWSGGSWSLQGDSYLILGSLATDTSFPASPRFWPLTEPHLCLRAREAGCITIME